MARTADIDDVLEQKQPILLATDQRPFQAHSTGGFSNWFCVLVPLMTRDGRRFSDLEFTFPNRGRVWWMLRGEDSPDPVQPGMIFTAQIELAPRFRDDDPVKDRYQVVRPSMVPGAKDWFEVLDVGERPDVADLLSEGIVLGRPTLGYVLLQEKRTVLGPLRTAYDQGSGRVTFSAQYAGTPQAWKAPLEVIRPDELFEFSFNANLWDDAASKRTITIRLVPARYADELKKHGALLDVATDEQVVNWALKQADVTKKDIAQVREVLKTLHSLDGLKDDPFPGRLARFRRICASADRVLRLGVEVAQLVATHEPFRQLVAKHAREIAEVDVKQLLSQRTSEVEAQIADAKGQLARLQKDLRQLEADYDRAKTEQEKRLRAEHDAWVRGIEEREAALRDRQEEVEQRLQRVLDLYRDQAREIGDQLVAQLPILGRLGLGGASDSAAVEPVRSTPLAMPPWFSHPKERAAISEGEFIEQFANVVQRRAFVIDRDDLVNFHVSVKTGFWTVIAGPSGIGKSSLPRFYAEALGNASEFLMVPVRPDWLDDRDVLGAFNPLSARFEPAATGLADRLIAAAEDHSRGRGGIYIICFDEMNLARVEHYLSQFLSVAELPLDRRHLTLFARGLERPGDSYVPYRQLPLGENVRIVGTVNVDETTHFFSPKVLDRTPVLTLERPALSTLAAERATPSELGGIRPVHLETYERWIRRPSEVPPDAVKQVLEIDKELRHIRSGLGFRVRDRVLAYVAGAADLVPPERALDLALAQAVVPRIRTQSPHFTEVVERLLDLAPPARYPRTGRFLQELKEAGGAYDFFQLL